MFLLTTLSFFLWGFYTTTPVSRFQSYTTTQVFSDTISCHNRKSINPNKIIHVTKRNLGILQLKFKSFEEALEIYYDLPILVSFTSSLCGPCKVMKKELEQVRQAFQEDVIIFHIDTDRFPSLGSRYNVKGEMYKSPYSVYRRLSFSCTSLSPLFWIGLPCTMMFKRGLPVLRFQGVKAAHEIIQQVKNFLPNV